MKNLLTFVTPDKCFKGEREKLVKLQIDNSLELGWNPKDIVMFTNFPYEYNGIKSTIIGDGGFCTVPGRAGSTKTTTVAWLLENNMLEDGEIYWDHDFDAYQMNWFNEKELALGGYDAGFTTYGWSPKWCLGSFFFKTSAKDIFTAIKDTIYEIQNEDERALVKLTNEGKFLDRIKTMNITYQIGMRKVEKNYVQAFKPIKVIHFHPGYYEHTLPEKLLDTFMYGKNQLGHPIMNERLIKLFHKYNFK